MANRVSDFIKTTRNVIRTRFTDKIRRDAESAYKEAIADFIKSFDAHPISRELDDRTSPSNILRQNGWTRTGTLFGFMGFYATRNPTEELRNLLLDRQRGIKVDLEKNIIRNIKGIFGTVKTPTDEELAAAGITLDQWGDGRSWPEVIETSGIENLPYFLAGNFEGSRSGLGLQIKTELNPNTRLKKMDYLSKMFKKFEKKFIERLKYKAQRR